MLKNVLKAGLRSRKPLLAKVPTNLNTLAMSQLIVPSTQRFKSTMNDQAIHEKADQDKNKLYDNEFDTKTSNVNKDAFDATIVKDSESD